jgi:hypothetical protein
VERNPCSHHYLVFLVPRSQEEKIGLIGRLFFIFKVTASN